MTDKPVSTMISEGVMRKKLMQSQLRHTKEINIDACKAMLWDAIKIYAFDAMVGSVADATEKVDRAIAELDYAIRGLQEED